VPFESKVGKVCTVGKVGILPYRTHLTHRTHLTQVHENSFAKGLSLSILPTRAKVLVVQILETEIDLH
jgi:hypothetical protein